MAVTTAAKEYDHLGSPSDVQSYDTTTTTTTTTATTTRPPQETIIQKSLPTSSMGDSPPLQEKEIPTSTNTNMPKSQQQQQQQQQLNGVPNHVDTEREWKRKILQTVALYPPGSLRLLALDTLRLEIVHEFARELHNADQIVQEYHTLRKSRDYLGDHQYRSSDIDRLVRDGESGDGVDVIFQKATMVDLSDELCSKTNNDEENELKDLALSADNEIKVVQDKNESRPEISHIPQPRDDSRHLLPEKDAYDRRIHDLEPQVMTALALQRETREYLPQLVSAILHSPAPLTQSTMYTPHLNPLSTLRRLLLTRCVRDPNLGIELCWLLEAEVGRAWKSLFEHRQQTGRRLIIVLPADRAAAIQQIGLEKRAAFDLLQDVESATAYGVYGGEGYAEEGWSDPEGSFNHDDDVHADTSDLYSTARLPASLSFKRCSHFGDTMHFIDLLTKISLDLRMCPEWMCLEHHRKSYLMDRLEELNRRLRRRMITKGNVSLDVEDNRGPHDWPTLGDLSPDCMKYSIHFPLEPTATIWPGGGRIDSSDWRDHARSPLLKLKTEQGVMRVLNIVSSKSRVLASRERCPYLVHCEVLETGLEGRDARLYASGSGDMGVTLQEALGIASRKKRKDADGNHMRNFASYKLPPELISSDAIVPSIDLSTYTIQDHTDLLPNANWLPRGGDQGNGYYYNHDSIINESINSRTPYDLILEERLQQLHDRMQTNQQRPQYGPPPYQQQLQQQTPQSYPYGTVPRLTTYSTLLNRVYGKPWAETCEEIRQTSPYGNVKGWRLASFIMKAGEDIRREALVMQVIAKMKTWFESDIPLQNRPFLKPYTIMCVGGDAGLLECLRDAKSVDEVKKSTDGFTTLLKKSTDGFTTLRDYFERAYGPPARHQMRTHHHPGSLPQPQENPHSKEITFERAQDNFLRSLVGYSLICYVLQIKDRHNANILLDREGHIMHIDFGFVLGDTPKMGKVPLFSERAPFKLTQEFWDVIGGWNFHEGGLGVRFCKMFEDAFTCASAHSDELVSLIEAAILNLTKNPNEARMIANGVRNRLRMRGRVGSV
eukprot:CAMPEP_0176506198 /NCGR_PEP_ID=MMETSP0200_2-20121128/16904_1 /TAXON_ID=947934 /ORGANISM="Chaetoceros sp., Strain GSL56" /LENGTH=1056 /DNA_ID=CAMNT_0017905811 /DNA_START=322 /DNA_END=3489 /DNA_ORIENTATION=-